jgi:hypothetical protein
MSKEQVKKNTEGELIWEEIKNRSIAIFSLPNQKVSDHVRKLQVAGSSLIVKLNSSSVLPALETATCDKFVTELTDKGYVIMKYKTIEPDLSKEDEAAAIKERAEAAVNLSSVINLKS